MDKKVVFYEPEAGVYRIDDTKIVLRPVGHSDPDTTHIMEEFLKWNRGTGVIETRDTIYKPQEKETTVAN